MPESIGLASAKKKHMPRGRTTTNWHPRHLLVARTISNALDCSSAFLAGFSRGVVESAAAVCYCLFGVAAAKF